MRNTKFTKNISKFKVIGAWLVIAAMLLDAPLSLNATAQQDAASVAQDIFSQDAFFGPDVRHLEERLAELESAWRSTNEQMLLMDESLVRLRETSRGHDRSFRDMENREEIERRNATFRRNLVVGSEDADATAEAVAAEIAGVTRQLESARMRAYSAQTRLDNQEAARQGLFEALLAIEEEIANTHEEINNAWIMFDLLHGDNDGEDDPDSTDEGLMCEICDNMDYFPDGFEHDCLYEEGEQYEFDESYEEYRLSLMFDEDDYDIDYEEEPDFSDYIDEYGNFWFGIDLSDGYFDALDFEVDAPASTEPPASNMTPEQIEAYASRTTGAPILIQTSAQLHAFIRGDAPFDNNAGHYELRHATNPNYVFTLTAATTAQGRRGVFTGIFEGNGHTIRGYRFRPINNVEMPAIGFFQEAGHGAVIRNVNFDSGMAFTPGSTNFAMATGTASQRTAATTANDNSVWYDSRNNTGALWRNTETSVGMVIGRTSNEGAPATGAVVSIDNVRLVGQHEMRQWAGTTAQANTSIAGMVGTVGAGTTLNMRDVNVANVTILTARWDGAATRPTFRAGSGLVSTITGGTLNVVTSSPEIRNTVNVDMRAGDRSTSATPTLDTGIGFGGGIVAFVYSGNVFIENTTVTSTRNAADPIRVMHLAGGIIGGGNDPRSIMVLDNVENRAALHANAMGGAHTIFGGVGGLVGRTAGPLHIINSRNYAEVRHQNNNAIIGGLVGDTGPASSVFISHSANNGLLRNHHVGSGNADHNQAGNAQMGGIIGQTRGFVYIYDTINRGFINKEHANAGANLNTSIGGIIGRLRPTAAQSVILTNVTNTGQVRSGVTGNGSAGGIIGETMPWLGAPVAGRDSISLNNVRNTGTISGGRQVGGIIGFNRVSNVAIDNTFQYALNSGPISANSGRHAVAGGVVGRASGANLTINEARTGATNTATIEANVRDGSAGGIIGRIENANIVVTNVSNSGIVNSGTMNNASSSASGGIVGFIAANAANTIVTDVSNTGTVTARGRNSAGGGIVGRLSGRNVTIIDVQNDATVRGGYHGTTNTAASRRRNRDSFAGGIVGFVLQNGHGLTIENATVAGNVNVRGNNGHVGGIVGRGAGQGMTIIDATNSATVNHTQSIRINAGGIVGRLTSGARNASLINVTNSGTVSATNARSDAGGIVGLASATGLHISNATNNATAFVNVNGNRTAIGGIVGRITAAGARIENVHNRANVDGAGGTFTFAGGIVGRSTGRNMTIATATNSGFVGGTASNTAAPRRAGGIIGEFSAQGARITNVENSGNVFAASANTISGAGGIVGRSHGAGAIIDGAINSGNVTINGIRPAGGIIGRQRRNNVVVRNAGNSGNITSGTGVGSNSNAGAGGIIGRSENANTRIEVSFNRGNITAGRVAGGIIGRSSGTVTIQDFYNIGNVDGRENWAGHGIIGRQRDTARITIQRGYVAGRVRGMATLTRVAGTNAGATMAHRPHNRTTLNHVYVDTSAFVSTSATNQAQLTLAKEQTSPNGAATALLVDTEFLTAGFLPGISSGPWRTGVVYYGTQNPVSLDDVRTLPYFYWQIPANRSGNRTDLLETEFFSHIRMPEQTADPSYLPAMDKVRNATPGPLEVLYTFVNWNWDDFGAEPTPGPNLFVNGTREFVPSSAAHFSAVAGGGEAVRTSHAATPNIFPRPISMGLISPNGIVGFETREIPTRIVIRAYDEIWGEGYWIDHADITVTRGTVDSARINNGLGYLPGILVINFEVNESNQIVGFPDDLQVRFEALGYRTVPARDITHADIGPIYPGIVIQHFVNQPMERVPFPIRVWVLEQPEATGNEDADPPPATPVPNSRLIHDLTPNAHYTPSPLLDPPREEHPPRRGQGYFIIHAMWGDNITGTAPLYSSYTHENLRFDDLFLPTGQDGDRQPHGQMPNYAGQMVDVLDLHIYIENNALPRMQFHFYNSVQDASFDLSNLSSLTDDDVVEAWYWIPENEIELVIHYDAEFETRPSSITQIRNNAANNWIASPGKNMHTFGQASNGLFAHDAAQRPYIRSGTGTVLNPFGSGGLTNNGTQRGNLRDILDEGFTLLQGSNPYRWVGENTGAARIHLDTTFDVISTTGLFYNRYGLRVEDFVEELVSDVEPPDGEEQVDPLAGIVPRINVGLVPVTPPVEEPYEEPETVSIEIHVYAYVPNADGTGYLYEGGNRVRRPVGPEQNLNLTTDANNFEPMLDQYEEPIPGRFTADLQNPAWFYEFAATADLLYDFATEINLEEAHMNDGPTWIAGDRVWQDGSVLTIVMQRPRHDVTFIAGENGTLSFAGLTQQTIREMELIEGTTLTSAAHIPTPVPAENQRFLHWERVIGEGAQTQDPNGFVVTEAATFRAVFGPLYRITFHMYDGSGEYEVVNVTPNTALDLAELEERGVPITHQYGTEDVRGWALWGWFDTATLATGIGRSDLDAEGRRNGFRRPAVGSQGFDLTKVITQGIFEGICDDTGVEIEQIFDETGNLDLFVIWSLWGDADDDDKVDAADITAIGRFLVDEGVRAVNAEIGFDLFPLPYDISINQIAANVSVTRTVNAHDITMVGQFLVDEDVRAINAGIGFDLFPLPYGVVLGQRPE